MINEESVPIRNSRGDAAKPFIVTDALSRNTVMDTFQSCRNHLKTPAYMYTGSTDDHTRIDFLISTEGLRKLSPPLDHKEKI